MTLHGTTCRNFATTVQTLFFTSYRSGEERIYQIDPDPKPYLKIERAQE